MSAGTYYLETFGCQMNVLDSELVEGQLRARGLHPVADARAADIVLFNTCSVRQHAEDKVLSRLGQLRRHKHRRPETIIGVIGCMAEREKQGLFEKAPHVDLLCGPGELNQLPGLLDEIAARNERVMALAGSLSRRTEVMQRALEYDSLEALDLSRAAAIRAQESILQSYIRVQRGCDKFCTYCVVPFTRGAERSRPPQNIVDEARMLAERGCREVTLLGQTVNSYVHQEDGRAVPFARLLERVHAVEGLDRIRFVTSFPADWDEDIFRVMRDFPRIMPYLHIPAQSGSDRVLAAMRRGYTTADYLNLMDTARRYLPEISLAGDFIVGFSGESEQDHAASIELVRRVEYKGLFVFKYSPRPGTLADKRLPDDVPAEAKACRNRELLAVQAEISLRQKRALVGRSVEVLVEGLSKLAGRAETDPLGSGAPRQESEQDRGCETTTRTTARRAGDRNRVVQLVGRTPGDLIAVFEGHPELIGAVVRLRVSQVTPLTLLCRIESLVSAPRPRATEPATNETHRPLPVLASSP